MARVVLHTTDAEAWIQYLDRIPGKDIVHYPNFLQVYEEYGDGIAECFVFLDGDLLVVYPYIRRPLSDLPWVGPQFATYCDIVNAYCYGGFVHNASREDEATELLAVFRSEFDCYAKETGVISEFIRFHPHLRNHVGCETLLEVRPHCENIIMDLRCDESQLLQRCRPTFRNCIRQAKREGLHLMHDRAHRFLKEFAELYWGSMIRHGQKGYVNFDARYFKLLSRYLGEDLLLFAVLHEGRIAAAALFLRHGDYLDYFLAASSPDLLHLYPNHFMLYEVACWARQHGIRWFHLGGGPESVLFFKRGFYKETVPYVLGRKIQNEQMYAALAEIQRFNLGLKESVKIPYFPAYRYTG